MTGTILYLVGWSILCTAGSLVSNMVRRRRVIGWEALRKSLSSSDLESIRVEAWVQIVVWSARTFQVVLQAILGYLLILGTVHPDAHGWFAVMLLVYIAVFYYLEAIVWLAVALVDLWLSRRNARQVLRHHGLEPFPLNPPRLLPRLRRR